MRKGQIEILNQAKRYGFTEEKIQFLSREDLTIQQLKSIYRALAPFSDIKINDISLFYRKTHEIEALLYREKACFRNMYYTHFYSIVISKRELVEELLNMIISDEDIDNKILYISFCNTNFKEARHFVSAIEPILSNERDVSLLAAHMSQCNYPEYIEAIIELLSTANDESSSHAIVNYAGFYKEFEQFKLTKDEIIKIFPKTENRDDIKRYYLSKQNIINVDVLEKAREKYISGLEKELSPIIQAGLNLLTGSDYNHIVISRQYQYATWYFGASAFEITFTVSDSIKVRYNDKYMTYPNGYQLGSPNITSKYQVIVFYNGSIYEKQNKDGKLIPLSLRHAQEIMKHCGAFAIPFFTEFYKLHKESGAIQTALTELFAYTGLNIYIPPINLNDLIGQTSLNGFFRAKYKNGKDINWNRAGLTNGYCVLKALPLIDTNSKQWLINELHNKRLPKDMTLHSISKHVGINTCGYIMQSRSIVSKEYDYDDYEKEIMVRDYINLAKEKRKKINLKRTSFTKIVEEHNELAIEQRNKNTEAIKIPKNSKFKELREILPEEFEWITTRRRLVEEGVKMRHCVASYAPYINHDTSAIYSLLYEPESKRYTIEFKKQKEKYCVAQIQSACDRGSSEAVREYIHSFID